MEEESEGLRATSFSCTDAPVEKMLLRASSEAENLWRCPRLGWADASSLRWMQLACVGRGICPPSYKGLGLLLCKLEAPDGWWGAANGG